MTSDSDDLEEALRQNLKLRRELAAEVRKVRDFHCDDVGLLWLVPAPQLVCNLVCKLSSQAMFA